MKDFDMITDDRAFQCIVENIYDGSGNISEWSPIVQDMASYCSAAAGGIVVFNPSTLDVPVSCASGVDQEFLDTYIDRFAANDPRWPPLLNSIGKACRSDDIVGLDVMESSELINDFFAPRNFRWTMGSLFSQVGGMIGAINFLRPRRCGPYSDEELRRLGLFVPHLRRSFTLYAQLQQHRTAARSYEALFSMMPAPMLLLTGDGRVIIANPAAERILRRGDGLSVHAERLQALRSADQKKLYESLQNATLAMRGSIALQPHGTFLIHRTDGQRAYQVGIVPLPRAHLLIEFDSHAELAMFIVDPEVRPKADLLGYQHAFGLTPAEARLAAHLVEGSSLAEIANKHRISITTVRSQLRTLFAKTETHRQVDLIRVLQLQNPLIN
jgi:DNA-binding CsgD family transcriptional regulator/PAS domain-containing protein